MLPFVQEAKLQAAVEMQGKGVNAMATAGKTTFGAGGRTACLERWHSLPQQTSELEPDGDEGQARAGVSTGALRGKVPGKSESAAPMEGGTMTDSLGD